MKRLPIILCCLVLIALIGGYFIYINRTSNAHNAKTIGEIPLPNGFVRVPAEANSFAEYLRSLPLKSRGAKVNLYNSSRIANYQWLSSGVVDLPLLSNDEQCADVCMRLYAEYLFRHGRYNDICFTALDGEHLRYEGGDNRKAFEKFMRQVFGRCNTTSLYSSLSERKLEDIQIGDMFIYPHHRSYGRSYYGHAIMVVDIAIAPQTGEKIFLLVEGNTPARDIHILRNKNPFCNPWYKHDADADVIQLLCYRFQNNQLRHFK